MCKLPNEIIDINKINQSFGLPACLVEGLEEEINGS